MKLIPDYLGREQCDSIKGIFILTVFFQHFMQYVRMAGGPAFDLHLGQMIVTLFLFYSGYGVMESITKKGDDYIRSMPKRRILTTLINFDIAVLAFVVLNLLLGNPMTFKQIALSFVCWDSVGNSNWYIFAIIFCYLVAFMACCKMRFRRWGGVITLVILSLYVIGLSFVKEPWWYDTILCFPVGMICSQYKSHIEAIAVRFYVPLIAIAALVYFGLDYIRIFARGLVPNVKAIAFTSVIVMITMRIPIRHAALGWLGKNLFPLYIYQRIPMIFLFSLDPSGFATWRMPVYLFVCFFATILIALYFPRWKVELK